MRLWHAGCLLAAALTSIGLTIPASASVVGQTTGDPTASAASVHLTLTGLNRADRVVAIPQASLLSVSTGDSYFYGGSAVAIPRGTYLVAAEVPTYTGSTVTSQTLVFRKAAIERSQTMRLDGRDGRKLTVSLSGAQATVSQLSADVCMSQDPHGQEILDGGAYGGPGVSIYAVPARSANITFGYSDILTSAAGASYYLIGSTVGQIPSRLGYTQRASGLAKLTTQLRSGAYGSSQFSWTIQSGNGEGFCGAGQNENLSGVQSWRSYLTPGTWTTSVTAYSQGSTGNLGQNAFLYGTGRYRAGRSYTDVFGAAVVGQGPEFPQTSDNYNDSASRYALLSYSPSLFDSPVQSGGQTCCDRSTVTLRLGSRVVGKKTLRTNGLFTESIRRSGWYTLDVTDSRSFPTGGTPALSPRVAVIFRFHASSKPAGNGAQQNAPLTDSRFDALGLNSANQAPAGGTTKVNITVTRPGNVGVASPVYRLKTVEFYLSVNGGSTWRRLTLRRIGSYWQATIADPASGYVTIRSIVTDVHGDVTEQTVYRAYAVTG
jgi:hypothetical protein